MKVNLNVPIRDFFGKPIIENEKTKKEVNMAEQIGVILFGLGQNLEQSEMVTAYGIVRKLQRDPAGTWRRRDGNEPAGRPGRRDQQTSNQW